MPQWSRLCPLDHGILPAGSDSGPVDLDSGNSDSTAADCTGVNPAGTCLVLMSLASIGRADIDTADLEPSVFALTMGPSLFGAEPAYGSPADFCSAGASRADTFPAGIKPAKSGPTSLDIMCSGQVDIGLVDPDSVDNDPSEDAVNISPPVRASSFTFPSAW